ncbi:MAG TPA: hypothetical protein VIS07_19320 [Candidatus Binatia bacterium]
MKAFFIAACGSIALGALVGAASADVVRRETTQTETISGTVKEITPNSQQITVMSSTGTPTTYRIDKRTTFVDEQGNVITYDQVRGQPVKIYVTESQEQPVVVERVVVSKPVQQRVIEERTVVPAPPAVKHETRTETRTEVEED